MTNEEDLRPTPDPLPPGFALSDGRYIIELELPPLRMGRAYKARDPQLDTTVAINVLSPEPEDELRLLRFRRCVKKAVLERQKTVYDYGEWRGLAYVVVPYVEGVGASVDVGAE